MAQGDVASRLKWLDQQDWEEALRASRIPRRFWDAKTDIEPPEQGAYVTGPVGSHKTTTVSAWAIEDRRQGKRVRYVAQHDLMEAEGASSHGDGEDLRNIFFCDVLIIDDVGRGRFGSDEADVLYRLIEKRWSNVLKTYITSNYSIDSLRDVMVRATNDPLTVQAFISRVHGLCPVTLEMDGPDDRLTHGPGNPWPFG